VLPGSDTLGPLSQLGVLVTRPARQAALFAQKIAALGGVPVIFPAIVILPPENRSAVDRAHAALADYDIAIFISPNAVEYGVSDPGDWPPALGVFAPGPGTAEALAAAGIGGVRIPATTFDSEGLLALPELTDVHGKRVLILRGEGGREHLGDSLRARGAQVDAVACYGRARPRSDTQGLAESFRVGAIDVVTVTSSEALDNLWSLASDAVRTSWRALPTFAPHPRIVARVRELGLRAVATPGGDAGLIAGLLEWAAAHPSQKS